MIFDANTDLPLLKEPFDCCVVGTGPAGITLALKLAKSGQRVVMLEAGDRDFTWDSQDLYEGDIIGMQYFPLSAPRLRYLGGTTGHWTGRCMMLDPEDFAPRDDVPLSGWPIASADLMPYRAEAADILGTPDFGQLRAAVSEDLALDVVTQNFSSDRKFYDLKDHEPVRFGRVYVDELERSDAVTVILNANLTTFGIDTETGRVRSAVFRNYRDAPAQTITADTFVMAMGALENARFLLHLNQDYQDRVGNAGGMVGRCFMEHPRVNQGSYFITKRLYSHSKYWEFDRLLHRTVPQLVLSPSRAHMRDAGILGAALRLDRLRKAPLSADTMGTSAFMQSLEFGEDYFFIGNAYIVSEQAPNPQSRVTLLDEKDRFGLQKVGLDLQLLPIDVETIRQIAMKGAEYLIRTGLGRMQLSSNVWDKMPFDDTTVGYSSHHMGGARMSDSSTTGVVDANCKVHGVENLFVAGSAVFATSGSANPTFTIVQLALRLADHLQARFG